MNARRLSYFLYLIARLKPEAWDAIHPQGPIVSIASREYLIAMAIKGFQAELSDQGDAGKLADTQRTLVKFAAGRIAADFEDDNWCLTPPHPIGPHPFGFSLDEVSLNPQPLPPKELHREIGGYLLMLSEATSLEGVSKDLGSIGSRLLGSTKGTIGQVAALTA
jgi:hypothetical protein